MTRIEVEMHELPTAYIEIKTQGRDETAAELALQKRIERFVNRETNQFIQRQMKQRQTRAKSK